MTDEEKEWQSRALEEMIASDGGQVLIRHIDEEIETGWEKFIALPVLQKTSKAAYDYQAKYSVLKDLKDWIASEIKLGKLN